MLEKAITWTWRHYRPHEGWFPFFLLLGAVISLVMAVLQVDWVPEASVVALTAILGLLMGVLLAKRPTSGWIAWLLITIYSLLITTIHLAQLRPPLQTLLDGWEPTTQYWRQHGALFLDRIGSWFQAVTSGGRSHETIVFAFGLGFLAWMLAAYVGWSAYRQRRPLLGLTAMGMAVAVNGYYGEADIWWVAIFIAFTVLLAAVLNFANLEDAWSASHLDFSDQIRLDLIFYAGGTAIVLLMIALILPSFRISTFSRLLLSNPAVKQAEDNLERAFSGVRQPRRGLPGAGAQGLVAAGGGMPRAYLLGDPPELHEIQFMQATVTVTGEDGNETIPPAEILASAHWRGPSYDEYTGRGWALSSERQELAPAGEAIPLPPAAAKTTISQTVDLLLGQPIVRYTLGLPLRFDQDTLTHWRGSQDLSWVEGSALHYQATSQVSNATPGQLQRATLADVPDLILARYTALPASVPIRVHQLAQTIVGELTSPYDQAIALERFLRQYNYSLDVELPPAGVDPVDFFLFEQQAGYCDYYASAMTVMARALGLPARIGVGFLPQPPDENGTQTIYQINGHSWAEIYFAGYGWIEFEPTAAFPTPHAQSIDLLQLEGSEFGDISGQDFPEPPAIPQPAPQRPFPWRRLLTGAIVILALWIWLRRRSNSAQPDQILWAYGRMQQHAGRLGIPIPTSQTPQEFSDRFLARLHTFSSRPQLIELIDDMDPHIKQLTHQYILRQYSQTKQLGSAAALDSWRRLRRAFWFLRLIHKLRP